jgi:hypothetical protein
LPTLTFGRHATLSRKIIVETLNFEDNNNH